MTNPPIGSFVFGVVVGANLAWVFVSGCRDAYWRDFNARHRYSNPPPPGRQRYGWGRNQLEPPPPRPGTRREYIYSPTQMAECGGPCWEAQDPRCCDCGALWRDVPIRLDEGTTQRGHGNRGPTTPKPPIKPQPQGGQQLPRFP
jgi:hypothetical protein